MRSTEPLRVFSPQPARLASQGRACCYRKTSTMSSSTSCLRWPRPRMGDPMSLDTQIGPVTTQPQYKKVLGYIDVARQEGAKLLMGGGPATRPECGKGWFVEPTIFGGVDNKMRIAQEEVFGPVLAVIKFKNEEDAVGIANDVRFGLGSGVWTSDIGRAIRMSERIQAGTVWVNTYRAVSYLSPFGGYKDSGLGRENGIDAIRNYLQVKSVWINTGSATANPFVMRCT